MLRKSTKIKEISHPDSFAVHDIERAALPYAEGYRFSDVEPYLLKAKKLRRPYILLTYSGILEGIYKSKVGPKRVFALYLLNNSYDGDKSDG
jgi:hypothetical protein